MTFRLGAPIGALMGKVLIRGVMLHIHKQGEYEMSSLTIKTNNVPRLLEYSYQLSAKELQDFDYLDADELAGRDFARYRGQVYDLGEFMRCPANSGMKGWDGYSSDSYFSGVLVKYCKDTDRVIMARYYC